MNRRLRLAIEIDCDSRVVRAGAPAHDYGLLLLAVGERYAVSVPLAASLTEPRLNLASRIDALTASRPRRPFVASLPFAVAALVLLTAAARAPRPRPLRVAATHPSAYALPLNTSTHTSNLPDAQTAPEARSSVRWPIISDAHGMLPWVSRTSKPSLGRAYSFGAAYPHDDRAVEHLIERLNARDLLDSIPGRAVAEAELQKEAAVWRKELNQMNESLIALSINFNKASSAMTDAIRRQAQQEIQDTEVAYEKRRLEIFDLADRRREELLGPILKPIQDSLATERRRLELFTGRGYVLPNDDIRAAPDSTSRITVDFQETDIRDVVLTFANLSGHTIVLAKGVSGLVTASIRNQPWRAALISILEPLGLSAVEDSTGVISVVMIPRDGAASDADLRSLVARILLDDRARIARDHNGQLRSAIVVTQAEVTAAINRASEKTTGPGSDQDLRGLVARILL